MKKPAGDNQNLTFLPSPGKGRFWEVTYSEKLRTKPMKLTLREAFREGSPLGETIGYEFSEANESALTKTAHEVLVRTADRKKFIGTLGVTTPQS